MKRALASAQLTRIFGLATAYWGAAQLFGLLALPPGFSAPIWPAAGIALGALYVWGLGVWPGVLLGSLVFNLGVSLSASTTPGIGEPVLAALVIATGATLQAIVGTLLARRMVGRSSALEDPLDVIRFLMVGGPVSCLVNASWSIGLLVSLGFPSHQAGINWLIWWAGDATGVMIFAPLFLAVFGTPADAWRQRRITVAVPLIVLVFALMLLFSGLRRWESEQLQVEMSRHGREVATDLRLALEAQLAINMSVASLYETNPEVGRAMSQRYLDTVYRRLGGPRAISWVPLVRREARAAHEKEGRRQGSPHYEIRDGAIDGKLVRAGERSEYFPIDVISPAEGNQSALGYDLGSEKVRAEAIALARSSGKSFMTATLRLVQLQGEATGILLLTPAYDLRQSRGGVERRPEALLGFVSAVFVVDDLVKLALGPRIDPAGNSLYLFDREADGRKSLIYPRPGRGKPNTLAAGSGDVATLHVAGRDWEAVFSPRARLLGSGTSERIRLYRYALLSGGALVISLLGALLLIFTGRQRHLRVIEETVRNVGRGNYDARIPLAPGSPLAEVESGINEMIGKIGISREELERRIRVATAELETRREEAEEATLAKSRVIAYASHDLRQPLHAMQLFISHLKQESATPEAAGIIGSIDDSVQALVAMLDGLLDLSRLESGLMQASPRPVPVVELWDTLHGSFAAIARAKNLELRLRHSDLCLATDPQLMQRILLNLVSNAIRYTDKGGVLVACRRRGAHARVQVWDTGRGIPPERRQEIFKEFVQLDNAERRREKGLGLGLSIVERAAGLLGHPLGMKSVPGRGSCFSLDVPLADAAHLPVAVPERSIVHDAVDFSHCSVLVVEDDALARRAFVDLLRSWGCVVTEAADAEEAHRALARGCRPDVIASDVRLPNHQNGINLVRRARATLRRDVAAFLISGDTDTGVMAAANAAGLPLLHKPVKAARLRTTLQWLLGKRRDASG